LPLLGLAAAYGINRLPALGVVLMLASVGTMALVTAIAIDPPADVLTPLQSLYLVRINQRRWADNLGTLIGLPLGLSLIVPALVAPVAAWSLLKEPRGAA
jgi:hypothetical protein